MEVELYDGTVLEFPDDTPDEVVNAAAKRETTRLRVTERKTGNPAEYDSASPEYQSKYGSTSGGAGENALAGAGKAFMDLGRGAKQLLGGMSREQADAAKEQDAPLMGTTAGRLGNFGGSVAAFAPAAFIPGANTYAGASLVGAGAGLLQPVGKDESRVANAALGAAGGVAGKFVGDKLVKGARVERPEPAIDARGKELGFSQTPGQATGNKSLQRVEAALESKAWTSGPFDKVKDKNAGALNKAWAKAIGEESDKIDSVVLDRAQTRIGEVFNSAADDVARTINPDEFLQRMAKIEGELEGVSQGFADNVLIKQALGLASNGQATGKQLQALNSKLGKAAYKQMSTPSGDRDMGHALYEVKDYIDDVLQSGMTASKQEAFKQARSQYRQLMLLTSRVGNVNPQTGNVSGRSMASTLQSKDKGGYLYGRNKSDAYDATRFAQAHQPIVGDSGTATRSQGLSDWTLGLPFNIAARLYASQPSTNAMLALQNSGQLLGNSFVPRYLPPASGSAVVNAYGQ